MDREYSQEDMQSRKSGFVGYLTKDYYKIHSYILTMVPNKADAEDVLQTAIADMWEHFEDFEEGTNFLAWASTIAKYHVLTYRKKRSRSRVHFSDKAVELIEAENQVIRNEMDMRLEDVQVVVAE